MSTVPTVPTNAPAPAAPQEPQTDWWNQPDPTAGEEPQTPDPAAPQATPQNQWFLRSEDGKIVYRTAEDAVRGLSEKDRTIAERTARLEQAERLLAAQGVQLGNQNAQQPQKPQTLVAALESAVQRGDMSFDEAITALVRQQTEGQMQHLMPLVEHASMSRAVEEAGQRFDPNIPAFVRSQTYQKTLERHPALKTSIQSALRYPTYQTETGQTFGELLPELLYEVMLVAKATAPAAAPVQRTTPPSSTPPQLVRPGTPQGTAPMPLPGGIRDPFQEAWNQISDAPLPSGSSTGLFGE